MPKMMIHIENHMYILYTVYDIITQILPVCVPVSSYWAKTISNSKGPGWPIYGSITNALKNSYLARSLYCGEFALKLASIIIQYSP